MRRRWLCWSSPNWPRIACCGLETELGCYGPGGFCDAVGVRSGRVARRHLSLDQSMVLAALVDVLADGVLQRFCVKGELTDAMKPLIAAEPALG